MPPKHKIGDLLIHRRTLSLYPNYDTVYVICGVDEKNYHVRVIKWKRAQEGMWRYKTPEYGYHNDLPPIKHRSIFHMDSHFYKMDSPQATFYKI